LNLAKTSLLSAIETGIKLSAGFLVLKYLSVLTGPKGIATFGQFQNFVAGVTAMCSGAFATGLVRYVSETRGTHSSKPYVQRATGVACLLLLLLTVPLLSIPGPISAAIFGTKDLAWVFMCLAVALPFTVLFQIILALLNGSGRIRELIVAKSASSLLLLAVSIILVTLFGVRGGLAALVLAPASAVAVAIALMLRLPQIDLTWFRPQLSRGAMREFLPFWIMSMTTVISTPLVLVLIRTSIGEQLGWQAAGYWEASWKIAELYLLVITTALTVYYVPHLSRAAPGPAEKSIVLRTLVFALGTSFVLAMTIYILRDLVVSVLFSDEFLPVAAILGPQLAGSVIKIGGWVTSYHMIVRGNVYALVLSELVFGFLLYISSVYLVAHVGIIGASYAFLANAVLYAAFSIAYYLIAIGRHRSERIAV